MIAGEHHLSLLAYRERNAYILDNSYEIRKTVPLLHGDEDIPNMHAFHIIDEGKRALLMTIHETHTNEKESMEVGFKGSCFAKYQGFREVNLESPSSDEVVFDWNSRGRITLDESTYMKYPTMEEMCNKGFDII